MRLRGPPRKRGILSQMLHHGKRAFGTMDQFLVSHGAKIAKIAEAAAPMLATKGGAYGVAAGAVVGVLGEGAGGYAALRQQLSG